MIKYVTMKKRLPHFCFFMCFLLIIGGCCCPHKFLPLADPPPPLPFCIPENVRVALVLGSGGVRGMAHVGVLEVLEEHGIPFDIIVGCSAGSLVGALYADNPNAACIKDAVAKLKTNSLLDIDIWNCRFGLCQGRSMRKVLNANLEAEHFDQLKIPLVIVATDLHTGELVPIGSGDLIKAVEASCSIPLVFCPVEYQGRVLVDGGTINPVPVMVAKDLGADIVIAVDLCELLPSTFPTNLFGVAARSAEIAFLWQNEVCTRNADIVIRPKMCDIGTFNDKAKEILYCAGREAALEALPHIKEVLESRLSQRELECRNPATRLTTLHCYNADYWCCRRWN
jgi:NTE family protein